MINEQEVKRLARLILANECLASYIIGQISAVQGGTGQDSSGATGNPKVTTGTWTFPTTVTGTELTVGGASDYATIATNGFLKFFGTGTAWEDIRVVPGSFDRPGVSDPTIVAYAIGGGADTYLWQFNIDNVASFTVQLPHSYKVGSDIYAHIHWTPGAQGNEESGNLVGWKIDYSWANIGGTFGALATLDLSDACDGTDHKHQMTPDVVIDGHTAAKGISSMLVCNVKRTDTGTDDTWATNTSGNRPLLLEIDFHFELDTLGSEQISSKT